LPELSAGTPQPTSALASGHSLSISFAPPHTTSKRTAVTREDILQALEACRYNRTMAASYLGISRKTFYRKLEELDIKL